MDTKKKIFNRKNGFVRFAFGWFLTIFLISSTSSINKLSQFVQEVSTDTLSNGKVYGIKIAINAEDSAVYHAFVPHGLKEIKGVLIHQHGCGMEGRGVTSAYDVQYQALAKKWGLVILGPDLYFAKGCYGWREPSSGSGPALIAALQKVGVKAQINDMENAPWLLWGHSGGGYWTLAMMKAYPERIMAAVCYSPAFNPKPDYPEAAYKIPVFIRHAGANDSNKAEGYCWLTALNAFNALRSNNGLVSIAENSYQNHNYSFIRYMAIPFYESILSKRLPKDKEQIHYQDMLDIDPKTGWLADTLRTNIFPYPEMNKKAKQMAWLPDSLTAAKWKEFVVTGTIVDRTRPDKPFNLKIRRLHNVAAELNWQADADIESGIKCFHIYRGSQFIGRYPETGSFQIFDTNGDDAIPMFKVPDMKTTVIAQKGSQEDIFICTVNHFDLESERVPFPKLD